MTKRKIIFLPQTPLILTVRKTTNLAVAAVAWTKVTFDTVVYQDGIEYDNTNDIATILEDGIYNISFFGRWIHLSTGSRTQGISINGVIAPPQIYDDIWPAGSTVAKPTGFIYDIKRGFIAGDTIEAYVHSSLATTLVAVAAISPEMTIVKLSDLP